MENSRKLIILCFMILGSLVHIEAADLSLPSQPLFVDGARTPLVMLVMGRDHTLYYEAYNDATDLNGDGVLDTHYKPNMALPYYGLFDSYKCYTYSNSLFTPSRKTSDKKCGGENEWSGDFLNYLTTSRIDALRKVLYGGLRYNDNDNDSSNSPILVRSYVPNDAHSWGKDWDPAIMEAQSFYLRDYAPFSNNTRYFFANTTLSTSAPNNTILRALNISALNSSTRLEIWDWLSRESTRGIAKNNLDHYSGNVTPADFTVRVKACVPGLLEDNCVQYPNGNYKPTGILHDYGAGDTPKMEFGLITGSYNKNLSGGVLRAKIGKLKDELDGNNGSFKTRSGGVGVFSTLNKLKIVDFNGSSYSSCGWVTGGPISNGVCRDWGNPIGEMIIEALRYFSGVGQASSEFAVSNDQNDLKQDTWDDPFRATGRNWCDIPVNLVISDINSSYDSDQIQGSAFNTSYSDTSLPGFNAAAYTSIISRNEGVNGKLYYIGDLSTAGETGENTPTAKQITGLSDIRGLSPQEPTKQGSYYAAGAAHYGLTNDVNPNAIGAQNVHTLAVALASPLPEIKLRVGSGVVTLIPYAKSVGGSSINSAKGQFQPTNTIVDYYVQSLTPTSGVFRINFEDVEQGADHDMDMIVRYEYQVNGDNLTIKLVSEYAYGGIDQHAGYVISGTDADGLYLDVKDQSGSHVNYYLDTVSSSGGNITRESLVNNHADKSKDLPFERTRTFTVANSSTAAELLPSPLWYAAKWGGFDDKTYASPDPRRNNNLPDSGEWDSADSGKPDNFFLVTNAANLKSQLEEAFKRAASSARSGVNMSYTSSQISSNSLVFNATFDTEHWSGNVVASTLSNGQTSSTERWNAADSIASQEHASRVIYTTSNERIARLFKAPVNVMQLEAGAADGLMRSQIDALLTDLPSSVVNAINASPENTTTIKLQYLQLLVNYLRGDRRNEKAETADSLLTASLFRERKSPLGDIVHSTPVYGVSASDKRPFIIFGSNDGMVHVLDAGTGREIFAYVPSVVYEKLHKLSKKNYSHEFYVDGNIKVVDVRDGDTTRTIAIGTYGLGAQGAWALDLTDLSNVTATTSAAASHVLWELNGTNSGTVEWLLGYIMNAPAIMSANVDGVTRQVAIFGNGYNSSEADGNADSAGEGVLLVVDVLRGQIINTLRTGQGIAQDPIPGALRPNSVTEPVIADSDLDGIGDALYAGDLFGNVWKVDIANKSVLDWEYDTGSGSTPLPLFVAKTSSGVNQPITFRPSVAYHPEGGLLVMFGTGKYIETTDVDVANQLTQSVYGIWDKPARTTTVLRNQLIAQTITDVITTTTPKQRETSQNVTDWSTHHGWVLDLYYNGTNSGERMNSRVVVRGTTAAFTTLIPSTDVCTGGGTGWYMEVGIYTGNNQNLVDHSAELSGIPSEPVMTFATDADGNKTVINNVKIDGSTPYESPGNTVDTGAISWQMLY